MTLTKIFSNYLELYKNIAANKGQGKFFYILNLSETTFWFQNVVVQMVLGWPSTNIVQIIKGPKKKT